MPAIQPGPSGLSLGILKKLCLPTVDIDVTKLSGKSVPASRRIFWRRQRLKAFCCSPDSLVRVKKIHP